MAEVVVVGQVACDLVLRVAEFPAPGGAAPAGERRELLGGKGANQAVGLQQLGLDVALVGVVGTDRAGSDVLAQAVTDGIDVSAVQRRGTTALLLDVVDEHGTRRLVEHVPDEAVLRPSDVRQAAGLFGGAATVCLQLQQPPAALRAAARLAHDAGARIVLDGGIAGDARAELLSLADVVRADAVEAELLVGHGIRSVEYARRAAGRLLGQGLRLVALAVPDVGDLVFWHDGCALHPLAEGPVVDPTGAGDAFVAGLVAGLAAGLDERAAGALGARAAASTVTRLGGRPDLTALRPTHPRAAVR